MNPTLFSDHMSR